MGNSSIDARALAAPNLKDLPRRRRPLDSLKGGACVLVGNFAQEGKFTLAVQWIVRSGRSFLLYRTSCVILRPANNQPDF
jgi:hypothetical protein